MTGRFQILRLLQQEDLNFLLTNRIPRRLLTRFDRRIARWSGTHEHSAHP